MPLRPDVAQFYVAEYNILAREYAGNEPIRDAESFFRFVERRYDQLRARQAAVQQQNVNWNWNGPAANVAAIGNNFNFPQVVPEEPDNMPANTRLVNPFRVGADPEFVFVDRDGNLVQANNFLPHAGVLGYDHGGRVAEVRPRASRCCSTVVANIKAALERPELYPARGYKWKAGGIYKYPAGHIPHGHDTEPLGGHVHLGIPFLGSEAVVRAMDRLTYQLEGCDVLPRGESEERRELWNYGRRDRGDGHIRQAGPEARLEYRAPASWLYSPKTTLFCLTGYKLAAFAPAVAMENLPAARASRVFLRRFIESFRGRDDDADRVIEKLIDVGGIRAAQSDPTADFKEAWRELP